MSFAKHSTYLVSLWHALTDENRLHRAVWLNQKHCWWFRDERTPMTFSIWFWNALNLALHRCHVSQLSLLSKSLHSRVHSSIALFMCTLRALQPDRLRCVETSHFSLLACCGYWWRQTKLQNLFPWLVVRISSSVSSTVGSIRSSN